MPRLYIYCFCRSMSVGLKYRVLQPWREREKSSWAVCRVNVGTCPDTGACAGFSSLYIHNHHGFTNTLKLKRLMPNNPYSVSWMYKASILSILILHIFVLYLYHTFIHLNPAKHHTYHTITIIMDWKLEITLASLQNFDQHFLFSSPSKAEGERFRDYSSSSCLLPGECRLRSCNLHPFYPG